MENSLASSSKVKYIEKNIQGTWVAQSVQCLTSAQVVVSWFVGSSPASGSVLMVQSLLGILSLSPPLSALSCVRALSLSITSKLKNIYIIRNSIPRYIEHRYNGKTIENRSSNNHAHARVHSSTVHNSQEVDTTQMSTR